jgi:hypothetical protein
LEDLFADSRIISDRHGPEEPQKQGVRRSTPCHLSPATMLQREHKMPAGEKRLFGIGRHH